VWPQPAVSSFTLARPCTITGESRFSVVPSPSWPNSFFPQHITVPSLIRAQECSSPEAMLFTVRVGVGVNAIVAVAVAAGSAVFVLVAGAAVADAAGG